MPEDNAELAREIYESAREGAWSVIVANQARLAPDVEFDFSAVYPDAPVIRGRDELLRWAESGPWGRSVTLEAERIIELDDERLLVLVHVSAQGEESGVAVEMRDAHELTLRDGILHRLKVHPDQRRALRELGVG